MIEEITKCRLCDGEIQDILDLGNTPPANNFLKVEELNQQENEYPLVLVQCNKCHCTQLKHTVDPTILFSNYLYESSTSQSFIKHFESYVDQIWEKCQSEPGDKVLELGCNDGIMMRPLIKKGYEVVGIDPAANITAKQKDLNIIPKFFSTDLLKQDFLGKTFDLIIANNVYAHVANLDDITEAIKQLLSPYGYFIFECQYFFDMADCGTFDQLYHEHLYSHQVEPLIKYFTKFDLQLVDVERVETHGGSIRCYIRHKRAQKPNKVVNQFVESEQYKRSVIKRDGLFPKLSLEKRKIFRKLTQLKEQGKIICAYGYPAKATTLCNYFEIGNLFDFVVEDAAAKIGLYTPKFHKPIYSKEKLHEADVAVILAWNFANVIKENNKDFKGEWVVPFYG